MNLKDKMSLRYNIMNRVTEYMYRDVMARRNEFIAVLHLRNVELLNDGTRTGAAFADSFYYEGKRYPENLGHYRNTLDLHKTLIPEMVEFLSWYEPIMRDEFPLVENFIRKVLNYSDDLVFNIALFPGALHACIGTVVKLDGIQLSSKNITEVCEIIGVKPKVAQAVSFRLMANLVGA